MKKISLFLLERRVYVKCEKKKKKRTFMQKKKKEDTKSTVRSPSFRC